MPGSHADTDIEQRVQRLADAARRKSPDVSQFPAADTDNDAWAAAKAETPVPDVASAPQASPPEARRVQVTVAPAPQRQAQSTQQRPAREETAVSRAEQVTIEPALQRQAQSTQQQPAREETAVSRAEIDTILAAARADLARDRLTTPAGANALERFQEVLARDPGNADATSGLHAIVTKYLALAERVARDGRFDKAESFLQRAERVGVRADALLAARQQLTEMRAKR